MSFIMALLTIVWFLVFVAAIVTGFGPIGSWFNNPHGYRWCRLDTIVCVIMLLAWTTILWGFMNDRNPFWLPSLIKKAPITAEAR